MSSSENRPNSRSTGRTVVWTFLRVLLLLVVPLLVQVVSSSAVRLPTKWSSRLVNVLHGTSWPFRRKIVYFPIPQDSNEHDYAAHDAKIHQQFMERAIEKAKQAATRHNEVPIGAVVVRNITAMLQDRNRNKNFGDYQCDKKYWKFEVLSMASNSVERNYDASAHAELLALREAGKRIRNWRLSHCTLYTTLEPCPMCLSAALAFRIDGIVFGAPDLRLGAVETYQQMLNLPHPFHNVSFVKSGVEANASATLLRTFFQTRRLH